MSADIADRVLWARIEARHRRAYALPEGDPHPYRPTQPKPHYVLHVQVEAVWPHAWWYVERLGEPRLAYRQVWGCSKTALQNEATRSVSRERP